MKTMKCLRCREPMEGPFREKFQLGQQGILGGHLPHLLAGALEVDLYHCPVCGKLEMYLPKNEEAEKTWETADKECPDCGLSLDPDERVCPCCGFQFSFQ